MIAALGGKTSLGISKVAADELAHFTAFRLATDEALVPFGGMVACNEAAHALRTVDAKFWPELKKTMKFLGLSFDE